jgi:cob(I)alamin adenosyltransferase
MRIYTKKGDTGTTGLLFGGARVSKADLRTAAYGTTDEAVSALGLARASIGAATDRTEAELQPLIVRLQRELFVVGAELATHVDRRTKLTDGTTRVTAEMVTWLEREIDAIEAGHEMPKEFVIPGETMTGAALDMARSIVRRAERRAVELAAEGGLPDSQVVPYLNRLADLLFVMARAADGGFRPLKARE